MNFAKALRTPFKHKAPVVAASAPRILYYFLATCW